MGNLCCNKEKEQSQAYDTSLQPSRSIGYCNETFFDDTDEQSQTDPVTVKQPERLWSSRNSNHSADDPDETAPSVTCDDYYKSLTTQKSNQELAKSHRSYAWKRYEDTYSDNTLCSDFVEMTSPSFTCDDCDKCFKTSTDLNNHGRAKSHGSYAWKRYEDTYSDNTLCSDFVEMTSPSFTCDDCDKCFKTSTDLNNHGRAKSHGSYAWKRYEDTYSDNTLCSDFVEMTSPSFTCDDCDKCFKTSTDLNNHGRAKSHGSYAWKRYEDTYSDNTLCSDFVEMTSPSFTCDDCDKCFKTSTDLNNHGRAKSHGSYAWKRYEDTYSDNTLCSDFVEMTPPSFTCNDCNKSFKTETDLDNHELAKSHRKNTRKRYHYTHSDVKLCSDSIEMTPPSVSCDDCDKSFKSHKDLNNHERSKSHGHYMSQKYKQTYSDEKLSDHLQTFHDDKANLQIGNRRKSKKIVEDTLNTILSDYSNNGRFSLNAKPAGSYPTALKIGQPDEFDFTVNLLLSDVPTLREKAVGFVFEDEIDDASILKSKRDLSREKAITKTPTQMQNLIPDGYIAVQLRNPDFKKLKNQCYDRFFLPYRLLSSFHKFVKEAVNNSEMDFPNNVTVIVTKHANGPAISLTIKVPEQHTISVDICPRICSTGLSLERFGWPRNQTKHWLTDTKIVKVMSKEICLVPKGDKYWKISFAECENELLIDIDKHQDGSEEGIRKTCLRIAKKKLTQWVSKSKAKALVGMSSYMLKTTLLWLCEDLPENGHWSKDKLAARYLNFLDKLKYCLEKQSLKEYFNPNVNLLEGKDESSIEELIRHVTEEQQKCDFN